MRIEIAYSSAIMEVDTAEDLSDKEVQDFLTGKLVLHGVAPNGARQSFGGRNALWLNRV
jgi:hypothetical protein